MATESSYSVTADFSFVSKYVSRGKQLGRASLHPSLEAATGPFRAGVWNNTPLRNEHDGNLTKEIDLYLGYTPKLADKLSADFGATYYWFPRADRSLDYDSFEVFGGLNWALGSTTPAVYVYRDVVLDVWTVQGSLGYSVPLKQAGTSLDFSFTLGCVSPDRGEQYDYFSVGVNLPVKLSDAVKLNFGLSYTENDLDGGEDPGLWGTAGVTARF